MEADSTNGSGNTVVTLTVTTVGNTASVIDPISALNGGAPSLADGRFRLTSPVASSGQYLSPQDTLSTHYYGLYRLFGDENGDGVVDQTDLGQFRQAFNTSLGNPGYQWLLDANNDTNIDQVDLGQFSARFNITVF